MAHPLQLGNNTEDGADKPSVSGSPATVKPQINDLYERFRVNPDTIEDLYPAIRRLARLQAVAVLNREYGDLEDVVSEATIMIWRDITKPDFSLRTAKFHTWCLHVLRHFFFRWASMQKGGRRVSTMDTITFDADDETGMQRHELFGNEDGHIEGLTLISEVAHLLNSEERTILRSLYEGYTQEEIAKTLSVHQSNVSRKITAIKEKLKNNA